MGQVREMRKSAKSSIRISLKRGWLNFKHKLKKRAIFTLSPEVYTCIYNIQKNIMKMLSFQATVEH
jgi:hypothetical protein